jgi:hypothetical protein
MNTTSQCIQLILDNLILKSTALILQVTDQLSGKGYRCENSKNTLISTKVISH